MRRLLKRLLSPPLVLLAAVFMFVEEFVWDRLTAFMALVGRLPLIRGIERRITGLSAYSAMAMFLLPGALLLPVKIAALWLVAHGQAAWGVSVILAAKIVGTALVARIFSLCRPTLLSVTWFRRLYTWIITVKAKLYDRVKASAPWQAAVRIKKKAGAWLRKYRGKMFRRRWQAIGRWLRWGRKPAEQPPSAQAASLQNGPPGQCE